MQMLYTFQSPDKAPFQHLCWKVCMLQACIIALHMRRLLADAGERKLVVSAGLMGKAWVACGRPKASYAARVAQGALI